MLPPMLDSCRSLFRCAALVDWHSRSIDCGRDSRCPFCRCALGYFEGIWYDHGGQAVRGGPGEQGAGRQRGPRGEEEVAGDDDRGAAAAGHGKAITPAPYHTCKRRLCTRADTQQHLGTCVALQQGEFVEAHAGEWHAVQQGQRAAAQLFLSSSL